MQAFVGEHLLPGYLGQFLIILSFISSVLSTFSYYKSSALELNDQSLSNQWLRLGRRSFYIHFIAIVGVFIVLFYLITQHYFEYYYVWRHSSTNLPLKYILSSFWEGSEGSFLLWMFWQAFLGLFVIRARDVLESRTMAVVGIVQLVLATMVLGFYFGDSFKIGSSPFTLLRDVMSDAPVFNDPHYLSQIKDGNGLNPLLQNYWMTIHPPVLFLGFAASLFPFAYALAALWKGEYKSFIKPALRWSLLTGAFLGLGIMLGGAWAYESLTFGGYWAWDPVENASLVPWLIIIAGLHTLVIYKATGRSLKSTLIFLILSYLFIWYSTFLTRTGILGDTSVHAFTDSGKALYYHILIVLLFFLFASTVAIIRRWKTMPSIAGEEHSSSREFWMLVGSFVILLSSLLIIFYTSLPVWAPLWKLISKNDIAPPEDPVGFYNKQQIWFGVLIAFLSAAIQFLKYKKTGVKKSLKVIGLLAIIAGLLTFMLSMYMDIQLYPIIIFVYASIFAIIANIFYISSAQKMQLKKAGGAITHLAFGLMLLAIYFSSYEKEIISLDRTGQVHDFGKETYQENLQESRENVLLFRNTSYPMGEYMVTYLGDSVVDNDPPINYFKLRFEKRDQETNELVEQFYLYPNVFVNEKGKEGLGSNPDARSYFSKDVFTYISSTSDPDKKGQPADFRTFILKNNDTVYLSNGYVVFRGLQSAHESHATPANSATAIGTLEAFDINGSLGTLKPQYIIDENNVNIKPDTLNSLGLIAKINKIDPNTQQVEFAIFQRGQQDDFIVVKVAVYPFIGLLWLSIALMFIGFVISYFARRK